MLIGLVSLSLLHPISAPSLEVTVVETISASQIQNLPVVRDLTLLTRLGIPSQPIERIGSLVQVDGQRTSADIVKLSEIKDIEVLRAPTGALYGRDLNAGLLNVVRKFEDQSLAPKTFNPSQSLQANGWTRWDLGYGYKDLFGDAKVFRVENGMRTQLGQQNIYLGTYYLPNEPKATFIPDSEQNPSLMNQIGGITFKPSFAQKLGTSSIYLPPLPPSRLTTNPMGYFVDCANAYGREKVDQWVTGSGYPMSDITRLMTGAAAQGDDMNRLRFPGDPDSLAGTDCDSDVSFPPGTTWIPDNPAYQTMTNYTPLRYNFEPWPSVDGAVLFAEMRTHCLNMELKEPAKGVRYYPYAPPNPVLGALMRLTNQGMIRGPWDQARTWIFTDKASLADVNKRLFPEINPGQYLAGLWDVARHGGLGSKDLLNKNLMDPALLLAADAKPDSFGWLSALIGRSHGKELAGFVAGTGDLKNLLGSAEPELLKHAGRLVRAILTARLPEPRKAMLELLLRSGNGLKDAIGDLRPSLYSTDAKEVELALQVCERLQSNRSEEALEYLAANGANGEIKAKAKSLL